MNKKNNNIKLESKVKKFRNNTKASLLRRYWDPNCFFFSFIKLQDIIIYKSHPFCDLNLKPVDRKIRKGPAWEAKVSFSFAFYLVKTKGEKIIILMEERPEKQAR